MSISVFSHFLKSVELSTGTQHRLFALFLDNLRSLFSPANALGTHRTIKVLWLSEDESKKQQEINENFYTTVTTRSVPRNHFI